MMRGLRKTQVGSGETSGAKWRLWQAKWSQSLLDSQHVVPPCFCPPPDFVRHRRDLVQVRMHFRPFNLHMRSHCHLGCFLHGIWTANCCLDCLTSQQDSVLLATTVNP